MTPRRRANALQAHSLHCQGLTYRQIAARMQRSASTIAGYIKDFHAHRDEIAETLAADQLVHSLAGINNPDPDLHQQHINAARELRLQVDTLDRLTDRRQRRDRRVFEEQSADSIRNLEAYEELAETLIKSGLWDDPTPLDRFWQTSHFPNEPTTSVAPRPDAGPRAPNHADRTASLSPPNTPTAHPDQPQTTPQNTRSNPPKPPNSPIKPDQIRTNPITIANDPQQNKANPEPNAENQRKGAAKTHLSRPNYPRGPGPAALDTPPAGTTPAATSPDATRNPPSSRNSSAAP